MASSTEVEEMKEALEEERKLAASVSVAAVAWKSPIIFFCYLSVSMKFKNLGSKFKI